MLRCLFDDVRNVKGKSGANTYEAAAVLRPDAVKLEDIIEHVGVTPMTSSCSLLSLNLPPSAGGTAAASAVYVPA